MYIKSHTSLAQQAWGITALRMVVGLVFMVHGLQKVFMGMTGVAGGMTQMGIPLPMVSAITVTGVETLCGLALLAGFFTRWAAIPLAIDMFVAATVVHFPNGFFLPKGYEFALTLFAASVSLSLLGSGALALDGVLGSGREANRAPAPVAPARAA